MSGHRLFAIALTACCSLTAFAISTAAARPASVGRSVASPPAAPRPKADSRGSGAPAAVAPAGQAPGGPPLTGSGAAGAGEEEDAPLTSGVEADPLVSNGLGSPLCRDAPETRDLRAVDRSHCESSGFVAAPAPTGDYGIDVHIDTGLLGVSHGGLLSLIQDIVVQPIWMALVWLVHVLIVLLEWSFTLDLLDSGAARGLGTGLRRMQSAITQPWLAAALAVASVNLVYLGLVRRRAADALGQVALALAMTAGGMWVILDPAATVGALGAWANQASFGTLAVAATGSPAAGQRALAASMSGVFAAAIEAPWCYEEFGDVGWCRDPARLDRRLYDAGLQIAAQESAAAGCAGTSTDSTGCATAGGSHAEALSRSAQMLRGARTNGAVVLALPANDRRATRSTRRPRCCTCCARAMTPRRAADRPPPRPSSARTAAPGRESAACC